MARTAQSTYSPKVAKKNFRAKAKHDGMTFAAALEAQKVLQAPRRRVDDGNEIDSDFESDDDSKYYVAAVEERPLPTLPSLLDIARTAKAKGIAREFEIVEGVRRIIALDDEEDRDMWDSNGSEDDDWEEIINEHTAERRSYSMAIRSKWVGHGG
ncbi:hypothetical protein BD779DRAFT_1470288 [Infundibulicybe gibba]|nr:hypothetical protein BD779DRAFT_1470288 [Infundibulicybe gibba]